jgi:ketosteroid isomerase-like protein
MGAEKNKEIAKKWFRAFNEKDLDTLLGLYEINAVHYSPKLKIRKPATNGQVMGHAALRDWWRDAFDRIDGLKYEPVNMIADQNQVFMEYLRYANNEEILKVGEVLEIRDGLICASRVYHG